MRPIHAAVTGFTILVLVSAPLFGQDTLRPHLGAGISVEPSLFGQQLYLSGGGGGPYLQTGPVYSVSPYYIYFPVPLMKNFRLEPRFGIYSFSNEQTYSGTPNQPEKDTYTLTNVGLSVEYVIPAGESLQLYLGPRVSLNFMSFSSSYYSLNGGADYINVTSEGSETDFLISGIFGTEYFPLHELSIGGEVDLNYVSFGNPDFSLSPPWPSPQNTTTYKRSLVSTGALFFLRWYFL